VRTKKAKCERKAAGSAKIRVAKLPKKRKRPKPAEKHQLKKYLSPQAISENPIA